MIIHASKVVAEREIRELAPQVEDATVSFLAEMYSSTHLMGTESREPIELLDAVRVPIVQGSEINRLARSIRANRTLEIGLAYGFSAIWMLNAIGQQDEGCHIAVDPYEKELWSGIGLEQVGRYCTRRSSFKWIPETSLDALTSMIRNGETVDLAFIDGNHRYDNTLLDFFLVDQILRVGGIVAFDDVWMPAVRTVASFVETNRSYRLIPQQARNLVAFEKLADDGREWDHFVPFKVHRSHRLLRRSLLFGLEYLKRSLRR